MSDAHRSSSSLPNAGSVNVEQAENSFHDLSRQLSQGSTVGGRDRGAQKSRGEKKENDLEKGSLDLEQPFDLREYLTSSNEANQSAGIKHKHVGVVWEDFHVDVLGGLNSKVRWLLRHMTAVTVPDASERLVFCADLRRLV